MTNSIAIVLGLLILGFLALDHFILEWGVPVFLMQRLSDLISYLAIWR